MWLGFNMSPTEKRAVAEGRCPNCYGPIPGPGKVTPTRVRVCDDQCVEGWMNGEEHLKFLEVVRELRALCT